MDIDLWGRALAFALDLSYRGEMARWSLRLLG
jgi:hypothetical protein